MAMPGDNLSTPKTSTPRQTGQNSPLVTKETTPSSLVLKLHLPAQRLKDLINPRATSTTGSIRSSAPPSSPIIGPTTTELSKPVVKKKAAPKVKKVKTVIGENGKTVEVTTTAIPASRLGPKSNAGVINENLRNLDRTGKPCRRWQKQAITVKSLYGTKWRCPTWTGESATV